MPDPFGGWTSRFPQNPSGGRITPSAAPPTDERPYGLFFANSAPVVQAKHAKPPTRRTATKPTQRTTDGKHPGTVPDTESYVIMD